MKFRLPSEPPADFTALRDVLNAFEQHCDRQYGYDAGIEAGYGFAHIVIDDHNLDNDSIDFCMNYFPQWVADRMPDWKSDWDCMSRSLAVAAEVVQVLRWLKTIPDSFREMPEDDDEAR